MLSSNVVNTVLAQYARRHYQFYGATGQPDFSVLNDLELGHNFGTNDRLFETRGQLSESVSWIKGNHIMKFGVDGNWLSSLETYPGLLQPACSYPELLASRILRSFLTGYWGAARTRLRERDWTLRPQVAQFLRTTVSYLLILVLPSPPIRTPASSQIPARRRSPQRTRLMVVAFPNSTWANAYPPGFIDRYNRLIDHGYWGGFAQDQWRIRPNLTFNYGLRWDFESGLAQYVNTDYNGFQPRLGIAYSPDSKTVVRAGFGIFFDRQNLTFFFVPNTQKIVAGYQCGNQANATISAICSGAGIQPQVFPNIMKNLGQASQGYQLFGFPASQNAAGLAASVIQTALTVPTFRQAFRWRARASRPEPVV